MSLDTDALIDRRRLKRRLTAWRVIAVVAILGIALIAVGKRGGTVAPWNKSHIARISVEGVISDDRARDEALKKAADDPDVKALIVYIDSPGGTVVGGEDLYERLRDISAKKPVVATMGTLAASGGYMTAIGADYILARQGTITGSIGVLMQTTEFTGLMEKLGVEAEAIKSAPLKAVPSPFEKLTPAGREATRVVVMDMYDMFVGMVAERRHLSHEDALKLADGRVFTGRQAVENKLVDAIGGEAEARDWLAENRSIPRDTPVRELKVEKPDDGISGVVGKAMGKALFSERVTLDGLVSLWHPDLR
ncbi:MAG TPA: signal peptide peptidase SppA [Alphaproteobacteria bacterium]|jgi:protease-4